MPTKNQANQLLRRAFVCLTPDAFLHPIWLDFINQAQSFPTNSIHNLLSSIPVLQSEAQFSTACQVLLVCTYLHNQLGNAVSASQCFQQAFLIAKREGLLQESLWSTWGASSIYLQNGDFGNTDEYLKVSQSLFLEQDNWVLANYLAVIQGVIQNITQSEQIADPQLLPTRCQDPVIHETFNWMLNWGGYASKFLIPQTTSLSGEHHPDVQLQSNSSSKVYGFRFWRSPWNFLRNLIFNGTEIESMDFQVPKLSSSEPFLEPQTIPLPKSVHSTLSNHSGKPSATISNVLGSIGEQQDSTFLKVEQITPEITFTVYLLGHFRVFINDRIIEKWPGNKGKQIFKYLVVHRKQPVHHEVLIDLLWPDMDPEAARRNLYQAIYSLRQVLQNNDPSFDYILTEESHYRLNPEANYWVDSEAFDHHYQTGQKLMREGRLIDAIKALKMAENLYGGEFLAEDRYEDWPLVRRENVTHAYLNILDKLSRYYLEQNQWTVSINYSHKILSEDSCREDAHRRIMRGYLAQGQPDLAIRQYHICLEALKRELGVPPMPATTNLFNQIKKVRSQFSYPPELRKY